MDGITFGLGAVGALLALYVSKSTIVPEFRPLFDIKDRIPELDEHKSHANTLEKEISDAQNKIMQKEVSADEAGRLKTVIETKTTNLMAERTRIQSLERQLQWAQVISRTIGFVIYVIVGGVFGSLLAGVVKIEGLTGDIPKIAESLVIGATWTTYLSTIGLQSLDKQYKEQQAAAIESVTKSAKETEKTLTAELDKALKQRDEAAKRVTEKEQQYQDLLTEAKKVKENVTSVIDKVKPGTKGVPQDQLDEVANYFAELDKTLTESEKAAFLTDEEREFASYSAMDVWDKIEPKLEAQSKALEDTLARTEKMTKRILTGA